MAGEAPARSPLFQRLWTWWLHSAKIVRKAYPSWQQAALQMRVR